MTNPENLPAKREVEFLGEWSKLDMQSGPMLKFNGNNGEYVCDGVMINHGTEFIAHAGAVTESWTKFSDGRVMEKRFYAIGKGNKAPDRDTLGDMDMTKWEKNRYTGAPGDPWLYQLMVPFENGQGEVLIFTTKSWSGQRAVRKLVNTYVRQKTKDPETGSPVVKIKAGQWYSKKWGKNIPEPVFEIIGWEAGGGTISEIKPENVKDEDMNDDIPF